jgi:hypothetical protein
MGLNLNGSAGREVYLFLFAGITNWIGDYSVALVYIVLTVEPFFEIKHFVLAVSQIRAALDKLLERKMALA